MDKPRSAIKLRQLEYFVGAAKTLNFSKAAAALFISQPALSQQIAELEAELGAPLFHRKGRLMRLTQAGEIYRTYAVKAIAEVHAGRIALDELAGMTRGRLRLGVSQSLVHRLLPPILGEFIERYPQIEIEVVEQAPADIEKGLAEGVLDVGLAFAPAILDDTELEPLLEERLVLVMRSSEALAGRESVRLAELDGKRLVRMTDNFSTRHLIDRYFITANAVPNFAYETNSIEVMRGIAAMSDVMAIIPEGAVSSDYGLAVVPLTDPTPIRVTALLWSRNSFRTYAARSFSAIVRERFPTLLPLSFATANEPALS
ncbi:MAG: LysR substrate-binding domain-containing protein [Sphingobium sp.]|uniref:LysR substrate-binding domain-containing protein n=1 Tax=Sphingobium sp. TaxID=1912891 RepID=UPI0029BD3713|nr:LysR substrate-binding domain-containing protein [Sphingobium sp.]MDX3911728.1 LysR substrate-binding domain-containing protein [Sphingobium sp.]